MRAMIDKMISQIDKVRTELNELDKKFLKDDRCPFCGFPEYMAIKTREESRSRIICVCFECRKGWEISCFNNGDLEIIEFIGADALIDSWMDR